MIDYQKKFDTAIASRSHPYLYYHAPRYRQLIKLISQNLKQDTRILDIGNSMFSGICAKIFDCKVDELGFATDSTTDIGRQYQFDANDSYYQEKWRTDMGTYDLIIFAEVIEHLYTSPSQVLSYFFQLLNPGGKIIIQTPNGAVLHKRLQLLLGKNPYMLIREDRTNPGHYREYTKKELTNYATDAGFTVEKAFYGNYFDYRYTHMQSDNQGVKSYLRIVNVFYSLCPPSFRPGITMVITKK